MPSAALPGSLPLTLDNDGSISGGGIMQPKTIIVRAQTLDGQWETLGVDRARGVWPENLTVNANAWGPDKASFSLHRDPGKMWPDLGAFTPVKIEVGGMLVWSGRISETPTSQSSRVINVQCEGWQYHLDDDVFERGYVRSRIGDWKDARSFPGAQLGSATGNLLAAGQVSVEKHLTLMFPNATVVPSFSKTGVFLDMGPGSLAKRVVIDYEHSNNGGTSMNLILRGYNAPEQMNGGAGADPTLYTANISGGSPVTGAVTFTDARRYVGIFLHDGGVGHTTVADVWARLTAIKVFADTAYESGNASILKATQIIPDALDRATILLSADRSQIDPDATVTFAFPEFALDGQKTPREVLQAANAPHNYTLKIDEYKRVVFKPQPSAAMVEIGEWPGSTFDDASANSGDAIYNRVVVEGAGADGEKLSVQRSASQQAGVVGEPVTTPVADNPTFATNTTSWTAGAGSLITRDTGVFDSSPASGRWDRGVGVVLFTGDTLTETFTGTFLEGITYTLTLRARAENVFASEVKIFTAFGTSSGYLAVPVGSFGTATISWTPVADTTGVTLVFTVQGGWKNTRYYFDSIAITAAKPTLVDRRGFRRTHVLPIRNSLTPELGTQIGDVWLAAHKTTPLKGTVRVEGDEGCREIVTGRSVPPEQLLARTGEMLRLSDRVDPDTGGQGRNGRIAEVSYNASDDVAVVALDSQRKNYEALLERLAIVVGS